VTPPAYHDVLVALDRRVRETLYGIYVLQAATAAGTFAVALVVFWALGYGAPFALAVLAAILQFIPVVGPGLLVAALAVADLLTGLTTRAVLVAVLGAVFVGLAATGGAADLVAAVLGTDRAAGRQGVLVALGVGAAALAAVAAIVASARADRNLVRATLGRLSSDSYVEYVAGVTERFTGDVQRVAADRAAFARVGATSVVVWTLDVATALLVFAAFDGVVASVGVGPLVAVGFFAVSVGNLAKVLPLSPGGVGLYEGAFALLVGALLPGVGWGVALGAAIVDHAVKNAVTLVGGVAAMLWLNVSLTTAVEESREVRDAREDGAAVDADP